MEHNHLHTATGDMAMSKMYFHFGFGDTFLFECLQVDSTIKLWSICVVLFLLTMLYEFIKYVRCVRCGCSAAKMNGCHSSDNGDHIEDNNRTDVSLAAVHNCYVGHLRTRRHRMIQTILHTFQTTIGFLIMLSVMSFNLCIIFAILVGTFVGHYVFYRPYNEIEAIDSCH